MKNIREWFPQAEVTDHPNPPVGYVAIPLQAQQWLLLREEELTEREKQLIAWLASEEDLVPNPWYQYLIDGKGEAPQVIQKMQLVYCHLSHSTAEGTASWLEMMQPLLPNFRAVLQLSGQDYVLILDQEQSLAVADILKDTVSAMEYDFNIRLSIMVGQVWTESKAGKVSPVIRAERAAFRAWIREGHQGVYRFSQLYLWGRFGSPSYQRTLASVDWESRPVAGYHCCPLGQWGSCDQGGPATLSPSQFTPIQD